MSCDCIQRYTQKKAKTEKRAGFVKYHFSKIAPASVGAFLIPESEVVA